MRVLHSLDLRGQLRRRAIARGLGEPFVCKVEKNVAFSADGSFSQLQAKLSHVDCMRIHDATLFNRVEKCNACYYCRPQVGVAMFS
jgi:hypothetical protein